MQDSGGDNASTSSPPRSPGWGDYWNWRMRLGFMSASSSTSTTHTSSHHHDLLHDDHEDHRNHSSAARQHPEIALQDEGTVSQSIISDTHMDDNDKGEDQHQLSGARSVVGHVRFDSHMDNVDESDTPTTPQSRPRAAALKARRKIKESSRSDRNKSPYARPASTVKRRAREATSQSHMNHGLQVEGEHDDRGVNVGTIQVGHADTVCNPYVKHQIGVF
jgi:hypothetical protein